MNHTPISRFVLPALICLLFAGTSLVGDSFGQTATKQRQSKTQDKSQKSTPGTMGRFLRIKEDAKGRPIAMQTSVTRYELTNDDGEKVSVDLIGVVHIGEKEYYKKLNKDFEKYDGLLYELVAPKGTIIPKGGRGASDGLNPIAAMQKGMQQGLGLEFQLEHIDYTKDNFVHADMSPEEFGESMAKNEESIAKVIFRAMGQSMAMQGAGQGGNDIAMLRALISGDKLALRRQAADQIRNMEGGMNIFKGKEGSTIIDHRNAKCMEVLRKEMAVGKKKLAIFYGAGHLPDMERRLESDFQIKSGAQYWYDAWKLKKD